MRANVARIAFRRTLQWYDVPAIRAHYPRLIKLLGADGEYIIQNWKVSRSWYALRAIRYALGNRAYSSIT